MKRTALKVTNMVAHMVASGLLGWFWGKLFSYLFRGFLSDDTYASEHPRKYLFGAIGILVLMNLSLVLVISLPLGWLKGKVDDRIDKFCDDKEWD